MIEAEERPVADRLDGVSLPAQCENLIGHADALGHLTKSYQSGKFHHAWLLSGTRGIGKSTLAFHFAKHMLSFPDFRDAPAEFEESELSPNVSKQVAQGAHPELLHLTRPWDEKTKKFKTQLSVEEIRRTAGFYGMTAGAGGWRITIVDAADDMNASAANALLKILEEPPKRSVFFVITHAAGGLLPTIRSRCQLLPLKPLSKEQIAQVLQQQSVQASDADLDRACTLSGGSVRKAIQLIENDVMTEFNVFSSMMMAKAGGSGQDWVAAHKIADSLSRRGQEEAYLMFQDLVIGWIGQQVRENTAQSLSELAALSEVWEKSRHSQTVADAFNLDKKQVILSLFSNLFERNSRRL